jgi:hypothetical protein
MTSVKEIKGVYDDDLPQLLEKLGLKDDFDGGRIRCAFSNVVITFDNFLSIFSDGQEIKFAADNEVAREKLAELAQKNHG